MFPYLVMWRWKRGMGSHDTPRSFELTLYCLCLENSATLLYSACPPQAAGTPASSRRNQAWCGEYVTVLALCSQWNDLAPFVFHRVNHWSDSRLGILTISLKRGQSNMCTTLCAPLHVECFALAVGE